MRLSKILEEPFANFDQMRKSHFQCYNMRNEGTIFEFIWRSWACKTLKNSH